MNKNDFIKKAILVHGDKYDYSKVEYINNKTKVCIICHKHGEFFQRPDGHLRGKGCASCGFIKTGESVKSDTDSFIKKAKKINGNKYDYSKVNYVGNDVEVCIICKIHGDFFQKPKNHLSGHKCPKCSIEQRCIKRSLSLKEFIDNANYIHNNKYNYDNVVYKNGKSMVTIKCPIHGNFIQRAESHLRGVGCPECNPSNKSTLSKFIVKANSIHNTKYDYSKSIYINSKTKLLIKCPEHGDFWQNPNDHLCGHGCPICCESKLEKSVAILLDSNHILYEKQKKFSWLGRQSLDFYLPDYNIAIECQGEQHFIPVKIFGGQKALEKAIKMDKRKKKLCNNNNVTIKYINYFDNIDIVFNEIINQLKIVN